MKSQIEYIIRPKGNLSFGLKELWQYRELFYYFTWRDIKVKYKQAFLGILWVVLQPLLLMVIFTVVFNKGLNVSSGEIPYPIFVYSGLIFWQLFANGLSSGANSMVSNANIIKKIYFPRLIIPISSILTSLFDFFISFLIFLALLWYYDITLNIPVWITTSLISLALTLIATTGITLSIAALNVKYRDFRYVIPFLIQILFFLSPVLYNSSKIDNQYIQLLLHLNPMNGAIEMSRAAFSESAIDWNLILQSSCLSFAFLLIGIIIFRNMESYFADIA